MMAAPAQAKQIFLPSSLNTQEAVSMRYCLYIYKQLMKRSRQNMIKNMHSLLDVNVADIETFAFKVLTTGTALTVKDSIGLLSETVKYSLGGYYNDRNIGIILKALEAENSEW
jgi:hypothetical protein